MYKLLENELKNSMLKSLPEDPLQEIRDIIARKHQHQKQLRKLQEAQAEGEDKTGGLVR